VARRRRLHPGLLALALVIAIVLWGMAHSSSDEERSFDVPVVFESMPEDLVLTDQSTDVVNIRVRGSRVSLRNVSPAALDYPVGVSDTRPGPAIFEVDLSRLQEQLPRGARIVSRSPARLEARFERRGRKSVRIRAEITGEPAEGLRVAEVEVEPSRVWMVGARRSVLRLEEVATETIDISGIRGTQEREVRLQPGGENVWIEEARPVTVRIRVEPWPGQSNGGATQG